MKYFDYGDRQTDNASCKVAIVIENVVRKSAEI